ncbi:MAG: NFACT RNA binding domain-containing protein [Bacillota bacterium]|nr:NFACT RNA binding domain-containing protein [Bacillota bacterium]
MPFDGVVAKCMAAELSELLCGSRIEKIYQPEADEIIMHIRTKGSNYKLLISANAKYPRIHITGSQKENPMSAPAFCMLLRKHLSGGKILNVEFHDFERIITLHVESINDIEEYTVKRLTVEIMGRYSNIILVSDQQKIMDSIKHVDFETSSVREVLPGKAYVLPPPQDKQNPESLDIEALFNKSYSDEALTVENMLLGDIKGFSPLLCREICFRAGIDPAMQVKVLSADDISDLKLVIEKATNDIRENKFGPCIVYDDSGKPVDFHCLGISMYSSVKHIQSISSVVDEFYYSRDLLERLKQKKSDLTKVLSTNLERTLKKLSLQQKSLEDVSDREKLQLFGELITANIYAIPKNIKKISLLNYYSESGEYIDIPLDENLLPQENAQRYFKRYTKAKNTFTHATRQLEETRMEYEYLQSVIHLLDNCVSIQEIDEVRQELIEQGYLSNRKKERVRKQSAVSSPKHFISSDGIDIFVGKNNRQNDQLTLKKASSNDIWLHTRNIPGSHVIIKKGAGVIPDTTIYEAALLAAYHSKARSSSGVPVDYTQVRSVKKPPGAKPGMVTYDNFKTVIVTPDEAKVNAIMQNSDK